MRAPNDDSSEPTMLRFQRREIADAAFIQTAAVIDHQRLAGLRSIHGFKKDINTPIVSDGKSRPGEALSETYGLDSRWRNPERNIESQRSVGDEGS